MPTAVRGIEKAMAILDWRSSTNELPWIFRSGMSACFRIGNVLSPIKAARACTCFVLQGIPASIERMEPNDMAHTASRFEAPLLRPAKTDGDAPWAFVILPSEVSNTLPRRGRTSIDGTLDGHAFRATLEPDGSLGHWLRIDAALMEAAGAGFGDVAEFEVRPVDEEPEPEVPDDLRQALAASPEARAVWDDTTTLARVDWIHWIVSAKQAATRRKRVDEACDKLRAGQRRVCCFDPSGHYSKAFKPPGAAG